MSIKPIDFQVMVQRTVDASKMSNDETQRNLAAQQQQAQATQHRAEDSLTQVYSRSQAKEARIAEKQKGNQQRDGKRKKESSDGKETEGNNRSTLQQKDIWTSTIDIKI